MIQLYVDENKIQISLCLIDKICFISFSFYRRGATQTFKNVHNFLFVHLQRLRFLTSSNEALLTSSNEIWVLRLVLQKVLLLYVLYKSAGGFCTLIVLRCSAFALAASLGDYRRPFIRNRK